MKNVNVKEQLDNIADFIRDAYSVHGVEVGAQGARSVSVRLPEDLPLTALCADLWNTFEAPVDLKPGPTLTVYASDLSDSGKAYEKPVYTRNDSTDEADGPDDSGSVANTVWWIFIKLSVWIVSFLAASYAKPFVQNTSLYTWSSQFFEQLPNKTDL